jgi:hypothetical protein
MLVYDSATTTRMMDRVMCCIMTWRITLSVLIKVVKVEGCGSGG